MTTVAYKAGFMASDSSCTDDSGVYVGRIQKIHRLANGALLGTAGDADARCVIELLNKSTAKKLPARKELAALEVDFRGILAFQNGAVFYVDIYVWEIGEASCQWDAQVYEVDEGMAAIGSGEQFALGAMRAGKSARDAVAIACHFDSFSSPPVKVITVKEEKAPKK